MVLQRPDQVGHRVSINSQHFVLAEGTDIVVYPVQSESTAFRTIGTQLRQNNRKVNKSVIGWDKGIFWHRQRRESGRGVNGVRDADAETRFDTMTLPLNPQSTSTSEYTAHFQGGFAHLAGELWAAVFKHGASDTTALTGVLKYGAGSDDWTEGNKDVIDISSQNADYARSLALTTHKGNLFFLGGFDDASANTERYYLYRSVDGATWSSATGSPDAPFTTDELTTAMLSAADWRDTPGSLLDLGNLLFVSIYRDPDADASGSSVAVVYSSASADGTPSWANRGSVGTATKQTLLVAWQDPYTAGFPAVGILVIAEGIYKINMSTSDLDLILSLNGTAGEGLAAARGLGTGALYVGRANGDIIELSIGGLGALQYRAIGPASYADGPVSARQGYATFIYGDHPRWLFVAYGGNASGKYASILAYEYETRTWHSVYLDATANREITNMVLSTESDGTMRLHFITEGAASDVPQMFEEPLVGSSVGATQQYRASGYVEFAEDDLGDPHVDSAVLTGRIDADDLNNASTIESGSGTNTVHIEHDYGLNGAAWTNVSNFGIYASDDKLMLFGKTNQNIPSASESGTPVGVSAKTIRHRMNLYRDGTTTNSPKLKEFEVDSVNKQLHLKGFAIAIDIGATALDQQLDPEDIDDRIDTIIESVVSVPLAFGEETDGSSTTYYVEATPQGDWRSQGVLPQGAGLGVTTERSKHVGIRTLYLEERIDV